MSARTTFNRCGLPVSLVMAATACATLPDSAPQMALGLAAAPPRGFVELCVRQSAECGADEVDLAALTGKAHVAGAVLGVTNDTATLIKQAGLLVAAAERRGQAVKRPAAPAFTPALWRLINQVNNDLNRAVPQRSDQVVYGRGEYWAEPLASGREGGDCEDIVLEKRRRLIALGVPANALSIAVVSTIRNESHVVLLVATDRGEYVLDNLSAWVLPWDKTGYQWRERQVAGSASRWVAATPPPQPPPARAVQVASVH